MKSNKTIQIQGLDLVVEQETSANVSSEMGDTGYIISGIRQEIVHIRLKLSLIKIAMKCYHSPLDWIKALLYLVKLRRRFLGDNSIQKMAFARGKYYMGLYTPGWNSEVYKTFIASQLHDFKAIEKGYINRFNTVFLAVTKKCVLQCEHCYEWDNLNKKDVLSTKKLQDIVQKLQQKGVSQIQFLGGEPLMKIDTLVRVLEHANKNTDFWVVTSGYNLNVQNAKRLKEAGLTGVIVSLDHFIPEKHNTFRNFSDAFDWAQKAVKNATKNSLVTALSLCVTKDFISEKNLMAYMELAKSLNVSFVQFLEPKAVGNYADKNVILNQEQLQMLEAFFLKMNFGPANKTYPIISYHGYYQRRQGCYSGGIKGMYIDTDGCMNACPFCHKKMGNVLDESFDKNLLLLKAEGCNSYK